MLKIKSINTKKISNIYVGNKIYGNKFSSILVIKTNKSDLVGYGETYLSVYVPEIINDCLKYFSQKLINRNPLEIEKNVNELQIPFVTHNGLIKGLISGLEIALWDIKSKFYKKPLFKLLNKNKFHNEVSCYASSGALKLDPKKLKLDVASVLKNGFMAYKMRIGNSKWNKDLQRIRAAKKALGKNLIMIDAIMGSHKKKWTMSEAEKKLKFLSKFNPTWIEEPLNPYDIYDYKILKKKINSPIAFGEQYTTYEEFFSAVKNKCSDFIQPDITMVGYTDGKKLISLIKKESKKIALHVWGSPISLLSNLHFAVAFKEVNWLEVPFSDFNKINAKLNNNLIIKNGKISFKNTNFYGLGYK